MDRELLVANIVRVARTARLFDVPIVLSTVNVKTWSNQPTIDRLQAVVPDLVALDRTTINAWEDVEFRKAVLATRTEEAGHDRASGRRLASRSPRSTRCTTDSRPSRLRDAVGGTSVGAHRQLSIASCRQVRIRSAGCS